MAKGLSLLQHLIGGAHFHSIVAEAPHYQSLKPSLKLTFLNLLTGTRLRQCNIIIEYQIIYLSDAIVLSFRDFAFNCSLEFLNKIFIVTYVIRQVFLLSSFDVSF